MIRLPHQAAACTQVRVRTHLLAPLFALLLSISAVLAPASANAQKKSIYATKVIASDTKGNAGGGIFNPKNALGAPQTGGRHVHSLGVGGYLTLGFDVTITDGRGADFIVFENPFLSGRRSFAEAMYVEVSSNGTDFARFKTAYTGPNQSGGAFALSYVPHFSGFAGITPVHAGSSTKIDPQDIVEAGGDAFDLADLAADSLVRSGKVKLAAITQIRLVDVVAGTSKDSNGRVVWDPTSGSADVEAIAVIHHLGNLNGNTPLVSLTIPKDGRLTLVISDPNGLVDLNPASLRMALDGQQFPPSLLLPALTVTKLSSTGITLRLGSALPATWPYRLAVSVKDRAGHRSGAVRTRL